MGPQSPGEPQICRDPGCLERPQSPSETSKPQSYTTHWVLGRPQRDRTALGPPQLCPHPTQQVTTRLQTHRAVLPYSLQENPVPHTGDSPRPAPPCPGTRACSLGLAHWVSLVLHGRQRQRHGQHRGAARERDQPRDREEQGSPAASSSSTLMSPARLRGDALRKFHR